MLWKLKLHVWNTRKSPYGIGKVHNKVHYYSNVYSDLVTKDSHYSADVLCVFRRICMLCNFMFECENSIKCITSTKQKPCILSNK